MTTTDVPCAVVVPVKGFPNAKERLGAGLDAAGRHELAVAMAAVVLDAAAPLPVFVACDDPEVAAWAQGRGAEALDVPATGLDDAVRSAVDQLAERGYANAVVAHSDLPLARSFVHLVDPDAPHEVVLVPDRRADGTNVVVTPTRRPLRFAYGARSFLRHLHAAAADGHNVRVVRDPDLGWDVDHPDDLILPDGRHVADHLADHLPGPAPHEAPAT